MTFFVPWFAFLSYSKDRNISPPPATTSRNVPAGSSPRAVYTYI